MIPEEIQNMILTFLGPNLDNIIEIDFSNFSIVDKRKEFSLFCIDNEYKIGLNLSDRKKSKNHILNSLKKIGNTTHKIVLVRDYIKNIDNSMYVERNDTYDLLETKDYGIVKHKHNDLMFMYGNSIKHKNVFFEFCIIDDEKNNNKITKYFPYSYKSFIYPVICFFEVINKEIDYKEIDFTNKNNIQIRTKSLYNIKWTF